MTAADAVTVGVADDDPRALFHKPLDDALADATGPARDDGDLAVEPAHVAQALSFARKNWSVFSHASAAADGLYCGSGCSSLKNACCVLG